MTVSGFSFIRNGIRFDYPFLESLSSLLPLVDELIVAVGDSDDDTRDRLLSLRSDKLRLIDTVWDPTLRSGGSILAQQTNIALSAVRGDWAIYLQGDEILHERDYEAIRASLRAAHEDRRVEGLLFDYVHFYGSHRFVGDSRRWYRHEIRAVRTNIGVQSWGDAQGFRIDGRKMRVRPAHATVYHYGWVKPPQAQQAKQRSFNRLWHPDAWVERAVGTGEDYAYSDGGKLHAFTGDHPGVMRERVAKENWEFRYDQTRLRLSLKERVLAAVEEKTGWRPGEYRNYELVREG